MGVGLGAPPGVGVGFLVGNAWTGAFPPSFPRSIVVFKLEVSSSLSRDMFSVLTPGVLMPMVVCIKGR